MTGIGVVTLAAAGLAAAQPAGSAAGLAVTAPALDSAHGPGLHGPTTWAPNVVRTSTTPRPAAPDFSGAVALSNCSGSIVRWQTSQPTDKALVLTNGHCYGLLGAHQVVVDRPAVRDVTLLEPGGGAAGTIQTTRLLYATMSRTDVALYRVAQTYDDLRSRYGVPAFTVASTRPAPKDQPIEVLSGYWKIAYDCNLHGFAYRLHEDVWTWRMSLRYSDGGCQVIAGTSGSPVLDDNRTIIGINNTVNEDGARCTLDNPCEEDRQGNITVHIHRGYGEETWLFYTCLENNVIDLSKSGCMLAKP